jgi:hypothetical protein
MAKELDLELREFQQLLGELNGLEVVTSLHLDLQGTARLIYPVLKLRLPGYFVPRKCWLSLPPLQHEHSGSWPTAQK